MKIIKLTAENIKKLTAVEITPDGAMVVISGKNGAGKSSVLDAIYWALAGVKTIDKQPIRDGEEKASIKLDLGEIVISRKFTAAGTTLTVTTAEGAKFPSPQKMLDDLIGAIAFDPLKFNEMPAKEQVKLLSELASLDINFDEIEAKNKADYDERTVINRQGSELKARIAGHKESLGDVAPDAVKKDVVALTEKLGEMNRIINERERLENSYNVSVGILKNHETKVAELEAELTKEREIVISCAQHVKEKATERDAIILPSSEEREAIKAEIASAESFNENIRKRDMIAEEQARLDDLKEQANKLTERMETRTANAQKAVAAAQMPVDGLMLTSDGVTYNGIPFEQINSAEKLKISTAIAMALNPKLRVIRIERGNDLDEDGLRMLGEIAAENDFQVWVEHIGKEPMSFHIEDGALA